MRSKPCYRDSTLLALPPAAANTPVAPPLHCCQRAARQERPATPRCEVPAGSGRLSKGAPCWPRELSSGEGD